MANAPSSEDTAFYILSVFVNDYDRRAGDVLPINSLAMKFASAPWRAADFKPGMEYAVEEGWIEVLRGGASFRLTEQGFSIAGDGAVNFSRMCNESITIERQDGSRYENVAALVTDKMVLIPDVSTPIAPGDAMLRPLPSGLVDRLIVADPGYHAKFHGSPSHYQVKYKREGQGQPGRPGYNIHVSGENARVNIESVDNSTNTVGIKGEDLAALAGQLVRLREAAAGKASEPNHYIAMGAVASAELAAQEGDASKVKNALSMVGAGGRWLFDTAKEIGVQVAAEALKPHLGLPPG